MKPRMIPYASNTGTLRNLDALRKYNWRILLTPANPVPREGLRHAIDNGAWSTHNSNLPFDGKGFEALVEHHGASADFVIAPDIVAGGMKSLQFSESWMPKLRSIRLVLLPLQDGMTEQAVGAFLSRYENCGLFLGGTTEFKLRTRRRATQCASPAPSFLASGGGEVSDAVNHPAHYNVGGIEVIDAIEAWELGFCLGNAVKYIARAGHKGSRLEDLRKARWYLDREIERENSSAKR